MNVNKKKIPIIKITLVGTILFISFVFLGYPLYAPIFKFWIGGNSHETFLYPIYVGMTFNFALTILSTCIILNNKQ